MKRLSRFDPLKVFPPSDRPEKAASATVATVVDHLFRSEAGRLIAILARRFGPEHLHLAEDVVQDALVKAMQTWPFTGVPSNPTAWILSTARNRAFDATRRNRLWQGKQQKLIPLIDDCVDDALNAKAPQFEDEIEDSILRMMFVCCHPGLAADAQVALTLKVICGFGEREIAAAFLAKESAIAKRLTRARQFLRDERITTDLPKPSEMALRVGAVQQALYLLFNEGYKASEGPALLREDLCDEAIRLATLLAAQPFATRHETHALLALMYLNTARQSARVDRLGILLTLAHQDRSRWDKRRIQKGMVHLEASTGGPTVSRYHLEAGISACHTLAATDADTDWRRILEFYTDLLAFDDSPVVALNRAVAVAKVNGAPAALREIESMAGRDALENYHLLHAVLGQLNLEAGQRDRALANFRRAHELATVPVEREHLARRMEEALAR
jgi:RNA polymerase sigma factor (sigma-70 family)